MGHHNDGALIIQRESTTTTRSTPNAINRAMTSMVLFQYNYFEKKKTFRSDTRSGLPFSTDFLQEL